MHNASTCIFCLAFLCAIPKGKAGITERDAVGVLEETGAGDGGLMTATASRLLVAHGWRELPNPFVNDSPRFAPPEGMEHG